MEKPSLYKNPAEEQLLLSDRVLTITDSFE